MRLATIPPDAPFLDRLAAAWLTGSQSAGSPDGNPFAAADGLILLPTRRAARGLTEAFLRASAGRPMLLPRIAALGGLDEAPLALAGALDLPPPVPPEQRLAALSLLVMRFERRYGAPATADRAWPLAAELAALLDEAARAEVDLAAMLPEAATADFAEHWRKTLTFLEIVTGAWPAWLRDNGFSDVAAHQLALLRAQAASWQAAPPPHRVWVAGTTGAIPAVADLLRVAARLPRGLVVLPGLDLSMPEEAWEALEDSHPQAGMQRLLARLDARRGDVVEWHEAASAGRPATLTRALLPPSALTEAWRPEAPTALENLSRLSPADQQEEALAIALILRGALERPGIRAALVTPDRELAARVSGELARFGVVADDSAGEPLGETPQAGFLRLLGEAAREALAPVPLLALLKHPLAAAGLSPAACRAAARALELACLRGPRPSPGLAGLRAGLAKRPNAGAAALLDRIERALGPLLALADGPDIAPARYLATLAAAAEALAASDTEPGAARLWSGEEGEALATHLTALGEAVAMLPPQPPETLPDLLGASLAGKVVHGRRALRRSGADAEHPRIFIWGLLEARLQSVELVVLGGLAEGAWPGAAEPGPWMSRPMRRTIGLPAPEERIGQMAHDFLMTSCVAPVAILSCPRRRDGAPSVPARWLARLDAMLAGQSRKLPEHPAVLWARALDQPEGPPRPARPPAPRPPRHLRPRRLSVTAIETWRRDPYAIYARNVLGLRALAPIEEAAEAADYGSIVHAGLHGFLAENGAGWPVDAQEKLRAKMLAALDREGLRPALAAWWRPRLLRIADWVAEQEIDRRSLIGPAAIAAEISGKLELTGLPGGAFLLEGRADRIERRADGSLAILDYKTGKSPPAKEVESGYAPQLLIEAMMAEAGGFAGIAAGPVRELTYWELPGGYEAGRARPAIAADIPATLRTQRDFLRELIASYDDPNRPYLSQPHPDMAPRFSDYVQLARIAEWQAAGDGS